MQLVVGLLRPFAIVMVALALTGTLAACDRITGSAADLQVGECFDQPAETDEVSDVQRQPCNEAHDAEVFLVVDHPAGEGETYPISLTVSDFVDEQCTPAFATYTGQDLATSDDLDFNYFYPTREGWNDGDREFTCFVVRTDDAKMTSSVRAGSPTSAPST